MVLIYSCSGTSNVAQLANYLAVRFDRAGIAQMSCIAGVGGDVPSLVRTATCGRAVIAIDGCVLGCTERVLAAKGVRPERIVRLHERGLRKRHHVDFSEQECEQILHNVLAELAPMLLEDDPALAPRIDALLEDAAGK